MHNNKKNIARFFLTAFLLNVTVSVLCAAGVDVRNLTGKQQQVVIIKHHGNKPCKCPNKKDCCSQEITKFNQLEKQTADPITINPVSEDAIIHPPLFEITTLFACYANIKGKHITRSVFQPHHDIRVFIQSFQI